MVMAPNGKSPLKKKTRSVFFVLARIKKKHPAAFNLSMKNHLTKDFIGGHIHPRSLTPLKIDGWKPFGAR